MLVLAGDIGGTNARFALVELGTESTPRIVASHDQPSRPAPGLLPLVEGFLAKTGARPERACLAFAGPVLGDRVTLTNLGWTIDRAELREQLGLPHLILINDFLAAGYAVPLLGDPDLLTLQEGRPNPAGAIALIGAGTGLGEAFIVQCNGRPLVQPSEGGHASFGPDSPRTWALLSWLKERHEHVSWERVLSGAGLIGLFEFVAAGRETILEGPLRAEMAGGDPAEVITRYGISGADPLAEEAVDFFVELYGAQAGNLALTVLATGGVYLAGGIARAIAPKLAQGEFVAAFRNKGRLAPLLEQIPVRVILNPDVGLLGAAVVAGL
ncbi:MAG: glucokinase [Gemmatimonadales bacterium]